MKRLGDRVPLGLVLAAATLYLVATAARDLQPFDSSEFVLNAAQLGVGHPPGQPAYVLLGALLGHLSPRALPSLLSWLSALSTVIAMALALRLAGVFSTLRALPATASPSANANATDAHASALDASTTALDSKTRAFDEPDARWPGLALAVAALTVPGVWDLGTRPEVYAPAAALLLGALLLTVGVGDGAAPIDGTRTERASDRGLGLGLGRLLLGGLCLGLAAAVHPAIALPVGVLAWLGGGPAAPPAATRAFLARTFVLFCGGVMGLLPYLWLPLAGRDAGAERLVWGAPLDGGALLHFLSGRDYRSWHLTAAELGANLAHALRWLVDERLAPWALVGTLAGTLQRRWWARLLAPALTLFGLLTIALNHPFLDGNPDYAGYLLPSLWVDVALAASLLSRLASRRRALAVAVVGVLGMAGALGEPSLLDRRRGDDHALRALALQALAEVPRNGVLLVESDHLVFPLLVLQEVEGARPDVAIVDAGWASSSWAWRHVAARHAELLPAVERALGPLADSRLPPRAVRIAAFLSALDGGAHPLRAETLALASLAGGDPRRGALLAAGGNGSMADVLVDEESARSQLAQSVATVRAGSLTERVLASVALARAEDAWIAGDGSAAWSWLLAGLRADLRQGLPPSLSTAKPPPFAARTPLAQPRALVPPGVLLLRMGDLAAASSVDLALECYRRSEVSEADLSLPAKAGSRR